MTDKEKDILSAELGEAYSSFRGLYTMLMQLVTILILADVTLLGFATSEKKAGIILIGIIFPVAIWLLTEVVRRMLLSVVFTAVSIEKNLGYGTGDWLATTFVGVMSGSGYLTELRKVTQMEDEAQRHEALRKLPVFGFTGRHRLFSVVLSTVIVSHVLLTIILANVYGWTLF